MKRVKCFSCDWEAQIPDQTKLECCPNCGETEELYKLVLECTPDTIAEQFMFLSKEDQQDLIAFLQYINDTTYLPRLPQ